MQAAPGFDAKGIETVRRDTCPAVAKTMERSLRLLFATRDLSQVLHPPHPPILPLLSHAPPAFSQKMLDIMRSTTGCFVRLQCK